jgi:hypothetical protein
MATFDTNPAAGPLTGSEVIPCIQGGLHVRTTPGALAAFAQAPAAIRTATASDVAVIGDADNVVVLNVATANTFTIPPNSSVAFPVGTTLEIWQGGAGQTTITAGSGVTILTHASNTLKLKGQDSGASLRQVAANTWRLVGDLEPV